MADVLLFGATGYTGKLTAQALADEGVDFAIAGRNRSKLEDLAARTGSPEIHVVGAGDVEGLTDALSGARVLITCVGPFIELGETAAEAAVRAKVHYIDSTGESMFIRQLIESFDAPAREAGVAMAPALGFDEVVADVAAATAANGMKDVDLTITYALPSSGSAGTLKSSLGIITWPARFLKDGVSYRVEPGELGRWSPMPAPLGPRYAISIALGETRLAPLHLDLKTFGTYVTVARGLQTALRVATPLLRAVNGNERLKDGLRSLIEGRGEGPSDEARDRQRFTVLAEARSGREWRNVSLQGADAYGLTAKTLVAGARRFLEADFELSGVVAPVQALGLDNAQKVLIDAGVTIESYGPTKGV